MAETIAPFSSLFFFLFSRFADRKLSFAFPLFASRGFAPARPPSHSEMGKLESFSPLFPFFLPSFSSASFLLAGVMSLPFFFLCPFGGQSATASIDLFFWRQAGRKVWRPAGIPRLLAIKIVSFPPSFGSACREEKIREAVYHLFPTIFFKTRKLSGKSDFPFLRNCSTGKCKLSSPTFLFWMLFFAFPSRTEANFSFLFLYTRAEDGSAIRGDTFSFPPLFAFFSYSGTQEEG